MSENLAYHARVLTDALELLQRQGKAQLKQGNVSAALRSGQALRILWALSNEYCSGRIDVSDAVYRSLTSPVDAFAERGLQEPSR